MISSSSSEQSTRIIPRYFDIFFTYLAQQPERRFSAREVEDKFGEVIVLWQLQFAGYAAANIHPWKQFKTKPVIHLEVPRMTK